MRKSILTGALLILVLMVACKRQQGPSLSETLSWMAQSYNPKENGFGGRGLESYGKTWFHETFTYNGCQITTTTVSDAPGDHGLQETFNLRDIDPQSIRVKNNPPPEGDVCGGRSTFEFCGSEVDFSARNDAEALVYSGNMVAKGVRSAFEMDNVAYAGQFAEAFRHAVELCGGTPSTFPWLGQRGGEVGQSAPSPPNSAAASAQELFKRVSPSVFVVEALDANGSVVATGSGVALDSDEVVTNWHVIDGGKVWRIRHGREAWSATVKRFDPGHDLCELNSPGLNAPPVLVRSSSSLAVGERVYAIGAPEGLELTLSEGVISGLRDSGGGRVIQTSAAISPGSSGGGLFDTEGRLVGITTFSLNEGQNLNFALPTEWLQALAVH